MVEVMSNRDGQFNYIELLVSSPDEVAASRAFFETVFGWSYRQWGDGYVDTQDSGVVSGVSAEEGAEPIPLPVVYTDDLESMRDSIVAAGGTVTREIFSFPGGRRFHFREPSGNELAAWTSTE